MAETGKKFRLITRSDFDGLACAVIFKKLDMINEIMFVHPKDVQDGKVKVSDSDITTNLPYTPGCHLAFDHHFSETLRTPLSERENHVIDPSAPSAARVVYNYYGGREGNIDVSEELMAAVDKADSAAFDKEEVLDPKGWTLLNFLMDARTGLGRFRHFRISNYQLMMNLIDHCQHLGIDQILEVPDVKERVELYFLHKQPFEEQLKRCARQRGPLAILDLRNEETIYCGNRFVIYALYPECNISIHVMWGRQKQNTVFAVGKSIFNPTNPINIGGLMLEFGGGGHIGAGTCQVPNEEAAAKLEELMERIIQES